MYTYTIYIKLYKYVYIFHLNLIVRLTDKGEGGGMHQIQEINIFIQQGLN